MAVHQYRLSLLELENCKVIFHPQDLLRLLKAWRQKHIFGHICSECGESLPAYEPYVTCCQQFYYNDRLIAYPVSPIAVSTPRYVFLLPQLQRMITQARLKTQQDFLVLPDPIYWQMGATLIYEKVLKFVLGLPMTHRTQHVQPASKAPFFYQQIQRAPLNYGSLESRSCGKATLIRQVAFGKRCRYSMRGMIVPDASLKPNEIRIPDAIVKKFGLRGQWIILNRMPSLQPENFVALQVPLNGPSWPYDCFGIPLEILESINGDFDGDEANIYILPSWLCQAECATILNPENEMRSFVMGLKLAPSQDMLVAYHLFYQETESILPIRFPGELKKSFQTICEVCGSQRAFHAINEMRLFYIDKLQTRVCFGLTFHEMVHIAEMYRKNEDVRQYKCALTIQIFAKAKGNFENLHQMFGCIGLQSGIFVNSSFMDGLREEEAAAHGRTSLYALYLVSYIWLPGYGYQKLMSNAHNMMISYDGSILDGGKRIIFKEALKAIYYEDVMTTATFLWFYKKWFPLTVEEFLANEKA